MPEFYLPYQFIPVTGQINGNSDQRYRYDYDDASTGTTIQSPGENSTPRRSARAVARHDVLIADRCHGRLIWELTPRTPLIVGNVHEKKNGRPTSVQPYTWKKASAVPGNTLRGAIGSVIELISQSSLRVLDQQFTKSFAKIHPDLVPWNATRREQTALTPAELLLGVVEDNGDEKSSDHGSALASRVRFSDALLSNPEQSVTGKEIVLAAMGAPNPIGKHFPPGCTPDEQKHEEFARKTASLYFAYETESEGWFLTNQEAVDDLNNEGSIRPNGRKVRLVRDRADPDYYAIENPRNPDQHMSVSPINASSDIDPIRFYFHIDFENLTHAEYELLTTAICPDNNFCYQIGLGKNLGLGQVSIKVKTGLFRDPQSRYSLEGLSDPLSYSYKDTRYNADPNSNEFSDIQNWDRYKNEFQAIKNAELGEWTPSLEDGSSRLIDDESLGLLNQIGAQPLLSDTVRWRRGDRGEESSALIPMQLGVPTPGFPQQQARATYLNVRSSLEKKSQGSLFRDDVGEAVFAWLANALQEDPATLTLTEEEAGEKLLTKAVSNHWSRDLYLENERPDIKRALKDIAMKKIRESEETGSALQSSGMRAKKKYEAWPD